MKSIVVPLMVIFLFIDACPFIFNFTLVHDTNAPVIRLLRSNEAVLPCVYSAATMVPMLVDVLSYGLHRDSFFIMERILLLIGCTFPIIVIVTRYSARCADIYVCMNAVQKIILATALVNGMSKSESKYFRKDYLVLMYLFGCISQCLMPYTELKGKIGDTFLIIYNVAFGLGVTMLLVMYMGYLRDVWFSNLNLRSFLGCCGLGTRNSSLNDESHSKMDAANANDDGEAASTIKATEVLPLFCSTSVVFYVISYTIVVSIYEVHFYQDITLGPFAFTVIVASFIATVVTLLPARVARSQLREIESSLEIKRSFVRYIGHEIRTPLNIASIGLDLLMTMDEPLPPPGPVYNSGMNRSDEDSKFKGSITGRTVSPNAPLFNSGISKSRGGEEYDDNDMDIVPSNNSSSRNSSSRVFNEHTNSGSNITGKSNNGMVNRVSSSASTAVNSSNSVSLMLNGQPSPGGQPTQTPPMQGTGKDINRHFSENGSTNDSPGVDDKHQASINPTGPNLHLNLHGTVIPAGCHANTSNTGSNLVTPRTNATANNRPRHGSYSGKSGNNPMNNGGQTTTVTLNNIHSKSTMLTERQQQQQQQLHIQKQRDKDKIYTEIRNAINQGTKILNDLLAYDKIDSNNMQLEKTAINVEDLVSSTLGMFVSQATAKEIKLDVDVSDEFCCAFG
jgi:signal transduction histidine kinase